MGFLEQAANAARIQRQLEEETIAELAAEGYTLVTMVHDDMLFERDAAPMSHLDLRARLLADRVKPASFRFSGVHENMSSIPRPSTQDLVALEMAKWL